MTVDPPVEVAKLAADGAAAPRPTRVSKRLSTGEGKLAFFLVAPSIVLLILIVGYPVGKALYQSFLTDSGLDKATGFFNQGGAWDGLTNYKHWLLQECGKVSCPPGTLGSTFYSSILVTLLFTIATVLLETIIGMMFALIMHKAFKGRSIVRAAILVPWAIPTAVTSKLWTVVFDPSGIVNKILGTHYLWTSEQTPARIAVIVADTWKTTPFIALLLLAGLQGISADIYEAARMDGTNAWQRFWKITLPLVKPSLAVAVIFRTLDALRMYDLPQILTGGANGTTTISILVVRQLNSGIDSASALSTITFIFIFAIALGMVKLFNANIVGAEEKGVK
jgi:ABC-type sugar transport system permease subunit